MCDNLCENVIDDTGILKNKDCVSGKNKWGSKMTL